MEARNLYEIKQSAETLEKKQNILKSLVQTIEQVMSQTEEQKYISDIIKNVPIQYSNFKELTKELIEIEDLEYPENIGEFLIAVSDIGDYGINNAFGIDLGCIPEHINSTYSITIFDKNWYTNSSAKIDELVDTVLHELQHSHYLTKDNLLPETDKASYHDTEQFQTAVKISTQVFKHSKEGQEWINTHREFSDTEMLIDTMEMEETSIGTFSNTFTRTYDLEEKTIEETSMKILETPMQTLSDKYTQSYDDKEVFRETSIETLFDENEKLLEQTAIEMTENSIQILADKYTAYDYETFSTIAEESTETINSK